MLPYILVLYATLNSKVTCIACFACCIDIRNRPVSQARSLGMLPTRGLQVHFNFIEVIYYPAYVTGMDDHDDDGSFRLLPFTTMHKTITAHMETTISDENLVQHYSVALEET